MSASLLARLLPLLGAFLAVPVTHWLVGGINTNTLQMEPLDCALLIFTCNHFPKGDLVAVAVRGLVRVYRHRSCRCALRSHRNQCCACNVSTTSVKRYKQSCIFQPSRRESFCLLDLVRGVWWRLCHYQIHTLQSNRRSALMPGEGRSRGASIFWSLLTLDPDPGGRPKARTRPLPRPPEMRASPPANAKASANRTS